MRFENGESWFSVRPTDQREHRCGEDDRQEPLKRCCVAARRCALRDSSVLPVLQLRPRQEGGERSCRRNAPRRARRAHCHTSGFFFAVPETQ